MSVGFQFTAVARDRERVQRAFEAVGGRFGCAVWPREDGVTVRFCRMGELFCSYERKRGKDVLTGDCATSLAGPGFHAEAVAFVDELAREAGLDLEMEDETGYHGHRDFERMREEHFYGWLRNLINICAAKARDEPELRAFCICWDLDQYLPEDVPGTAVTPFGRLDIRGVNEQVEREGVEGFAREFFFWNEREKDARFYRNVALSMFWEDCYFMPGSRGDIDRGINGRILGLLERAAEMDRTLPFPKREYRALCALEGRAPVPLDGLPEYRAKYPIGYRKGIVTEKIGFFKFKLHGRFLYEQDEREKGGVDHVWYDGLSEGWHNLRMTAFQRREGGAAFYGKLFDGCAEPYREFEAGDGVGRAAFAGKAAGEDGESYYQTIGEVICGPQAVLITMSYQWEADRAWAMRVFESFRGALPEQGA